METRDDIIRELREELAESRAEIERLKGDLQTAKLVQSQSVDSVSAQLVDMLSELRAEIKGLKQEQETKLGPLFSESLSEYLEHKKKEKGRDHKYVNYTIPNAVQGFIDVVGDKPLGEYREADLEEYGFLLARVPANKAKLRLFKNMSLQEAADHNDGLRKPHRTLSESSILRGYLTPLRGCVDWLCTHYDLPPRWRGYQVKAPKSATSKAPRESLTYEQLGSFFLTALKQVRRDDRWLPVLGFFTGARLSELVFLQGGDIKKESGTWVIDLTQPLIIGGIETPRTMKTRASERKIALHGSLEDGGFIAYAKSRNKAQWLFPQLHHNIKRPADTASKRMSRLMDRAGLSDPSLTFHSLRHTAKDWLRDCNFNPRDTKLQIGHTLASVEEQYGRKLLRKEQLEVLRDLPLPDPLSKIWPPK